MARVIAVLLSGMLCACGVASNGGAGGGCAATARAAYPAGPYDVISGATIADLSFVTPSDGSTSLGDFHAGTDVSLIYLATAAEWCAACIDEQATLQSWHTTYGPRGLAVVVSVFEDLNYQPAGAQAAAKWVSRNNVDFTVVADPSFVLRSYCPGGDTTATPLNLIIDACTMEIILSSVGVDTNAVRALIEARL